MEQASRWDFRFWYFNIPRSKLVHGDFYDIRANPKHTEGALFEGLGERTMWG